MEVELRYVIKFFGEEDMKGVEITDKLNKCSDGGTFQRTQVCHWIKEIKSGRKDLSKALPTGRGPDEGLDDCIANSLKENPRFSTKKIVKALNSTSTTVRNHSIKSFGDEMPPYATGRLHVNGGTKV
jgi:hypothetical protein